MEQVSLLNFPSSAAVLLENAIDNTFICVGRHDVDGLKLLLDLTNPVHMVNFMSYI